MFARHETFHPRYGWLKKAVDAAYANPDAFNADDAVVVLGVGKNMVKSMRFWGVAHKLLVPAREAGSRHVLSVPSVVGRTLMGDGGWDPYGEFDGTQWLLHWMLLSPQSVVPVWWLAFNEFSALEFVDEELGAFVTDRTEGSNASEAAIRKDVACFVRMYLGGTTARSSFDDAVDCPTRSLHLLTRGVDSGSLRFNIGRKASLPQEIVAFACLDFMARTGVSARTMSIASLASEPGSPGRAFKVSEPDLAALLDSVCDVRDDISIAMSAGAPQLTFSDDASVVGTEVLFDYYHRVNRAARHPDAQLVCGPQASLPADGTPKNLMFPGMEL